MSKLQQERLESDKRFEETKTRLSDLTDRMEDELAASELLKSKLGDFELRNERLCAEHATALQQQSDLLEEQSRERVTSAICLTKASMDSDFKSRVEVMESEASAAMASTKQEHEQHVASLRQEFDGALGDHLLKVSDIVSCWL